MPKGLIVFILTLLLTVALQTMHAAENDAPQTPSATDAHDTNAPDEHGSAPVAPSTELADEPAATEAAAPPPNPGYVARAQLTTAVKELEPVDKIAEVPAGADRVYYFTELRAMAGHTVKHRWEYKGKLFNEITIEVKGVRWRTYTRRSLKPEWAGPWKVSVVDARGQTLAATSFIYKPEATSGQ